MIAFNPTMALSFPLRTLLFCITCLTQTGVVEAATRRIAIIIWTKTSTTEVGGSPASVKSAFDSIGAYYAENSFGTATFQFDVYGYYRGHPEIDCADTSAMARLAIGDGYVAGNYSYTFFMGPDCGPSYYEGVGRLPTFARPYQHLLFDFGRIVGIRSGPGGLICRDRSGNYVTFSDQCTVNVYLQFGPNGSGEDFGMGHYQAFVKAAQGWAIQSQTIRAPNSGVYTIAPLEVRTSAINQLVVLTKASYHLEYRQPAPYEDPRFAGVVIYKNFHLVDASPDGLLGMNGGSPVLHAGKTVYDPTTQTSFTVLSATRSEARVEVAFGALDCVRRNPSMTVTPAAMRGVQGATLTFGASVTNNDSVGCGPAEFGFRSNVPAEMPEALSLAPGQTRSVEIKVTPTGKSSATYPLTATVFNRAAPDSLGSASATYTLSTAQSSATFMTTDSTTLGNWKGKYGKSGWSVPADSESLPSFARLSVNNPKGQIVNAGYSNEPQVLQSGRDDRRRFTAWQSENSLVLELNLIDGQKHQVAMYGYAGGCVSNAQRPAMTVTLMDGADSSIVLDTRTLVDVGQYLVWTVSGRVKIQLVGQTCGVWLSGVFID